MAFEVDRTSSKNTVIPERDVDISMTLEIPSFLEIFKVTQALQPNCIFNIFIYALQCKLIKVD